MIKTNRIVRINSCTAHLLAEKVHKKSLSNSCDWKCHKKPHDINASYDLTASALNLRKNLSLTIYARRIESFLKADRLKYNPFAGEKHRIFGNVAMEMCCPNNRRGERAWICTWLPSLSAWNVLCGTRHFPYIFEFEVWTKSNYFRAALFCTLASIVRGVVSCYRY